MISKIAVLVFISKLDESENKYTSIITFSSNECSVQPVKMPKLARAFALIQIKAFRQTDRQTDRQNTLCIDWGVKHENEHE